MTISYNWISEYIPVTIEPESVSRILTSIGLEVESLERYESVRGGLEGLVVGEVLEAVPHPGADKLTLTRVNVGTRTLQIVCGAPNVAAGQKVAVAPVGSTIFPVKGDPTIMRTARIRGEESHGMICAEDEIGLGESHDGIIVLPEGLAPGMPLADHFKPYTDWIFEIGLTPNRMDAMSHFGVARDICAYISHHENRPLRAARPVAGDLTLPSAGLPVSVVINNTEACKRYSGLCLSNVSVAPSPEWLQHRLRAIGVRPINNIVDITNYVLHDTGQPLHAYDYDRVGGHQIVVQNLDAGTPFVTLDGKERRLAADDLMVCDGGGRPLCIAGVFGGADSGVTETTHTVFLESAWFSPLAIRKTSFRHGLRTDAASRFEKNVDIGNTVQSLQRAAQLIVEIAGARAASPLIDVYPQPVKKNVLAFRYDFLGRLSGKQYSPGTVKNILESLDFTIVDERAEEVVLAVPFSKPDITVPADLVEEVMRIDGYDNIDIPAAITITPSVGGADPQQLRREKVAQYLVGLGFNEIFTNSITNSAYFEAGELGGAVALLNNLSAVHNVLRPSMLETGLESVAHNLNRKNADLLFFEFGKTYHQSAAGKYLERDHLCMYVTGNRRPASWSSKAMASDIYYLKGVVGSVLTLLGVTGYSWETNQVEKLTSSLSITAGKEILAEAGIVSRQELGRFGIRQEVLFADIRWNVLQSLAEKKQVHFTPIANQLPVHRDLAMVVPRSLPFHAVEATVKKIKLGKLRSVELFDVFESEKLGRDKKSFAVSFTFLDGEKTLTDKEVEGMMNRIMHALEQDLSAEIRKGS